jgi:DNA-directed RNA polymerase specialized sigma24 family protein
MSAIRSEEYAAVVERERPLILATAYLVTGDPTQAERVVQLVFAELYGRWPRVLDLRLESLRAAVNAAGAPVDLPWEFRERIELIDGPPPVAAGEPIIADLLTLRFSERVAIVLERYAGLSSVAIAEVMEWPVEHLPSLLLRARAALAAGHPARSSDAALTQELTDAIPYDMRESRGSADDLAHGRRLIRRRWIQRASAALVAAVLIAVAAVLLGPTRPSPVPPLAPSVPVATPSGQACDTSSATCRAKVLFGWRSEMAAVAASYLDPRGRYFSGFGYSYDNRYDMPGFWDGQGGALAFEMFRLDKGATEIYLQIATSRKYAVRCGFTTHQPCQSIRFLDGNSFLLTETTSVRQGIEVQYSPGGAEVITVVAHNTQRGQVLEIDRGDLIELVQDPRLQLPKR